MAHTTRRREPGEVANPKRSIKKSSRRSDRKNSKRKLQEIDCQNPDSLDNIDDEELYVRGID
jgi:hypothetical protein